MKDADKGWDKGTKYNSDSRRSMRKYIKVLGVLYEYIYVYCKISFKIDVQR